MAEKYFCAYHSYLKSIGPLNDSERGRLFTALLEYSSTGIEPELKGNERYAFAFIREQIDRDTEEYNTKSERQRKNANVRWHATECQAMPPHATTCQTCHEKEKEKEKEKETMSVCPEPETVSEPPVITLTLNTGDEYAITAAAATEWAALYPAVDILQELRKMRGWLKANPTKRKTRKGIARFVNNWLAAEQDKGGKKRAAPKNSNVFADLVRGGDLDD